MSLFPRVSDFAPIFRLLDDYDIHRSSRGGTSVRGFAPRFDIREAKDAYYLDGELPGLDRSDINIEFSDPQTIVISGHVEHRYQSPQEGEPSESPSTAVQRAPSDKDKQLSRRTTGPAGGQYWVSERSTGEFHRSFSFPTRVDQSNVKASLKNGILSVVVPKTTASPGRRIAIE
jgi:HSP20 family molecular chaperone IbpA